MQIMNIRQVSERMLVREIESECELARVSVSEQEWV